MRVEQLLAMTAKNPKFRRDWITASFAGVAGLVWAMARHCLMNRVNDLLH
jgi:hypothetical protein